MSEQPFHVLFLCTGNAVRSIMAEALLNQMGQGRFKAHSGGTKPKGAVNPRALALLEMMKVEAKGLRSKHWQEHLAPGAPKFDFVFTVCDETAGEECPEWSAGPLTATWPVPDPLEIDGGETEQAIAFADAFRMLRNRIGIFINLPIGALDRLSLQRKLDEIGQNRTTDG